MTCPVRAGTCLVMLTSSYATNSLSGAPETSYGRIFHGLSRGRDIDGCDGRGLDDWTAGYLKSIYLLLRCVCCSVLVHFDLAVEPGRPPCRGI